MNNVINEINQRLENVLSPCPDSKVKSYVLFFKSRGKAG